MNWVEGSILLFGGLVAVMGLGLPVAFAFLVLNVIGAILFLGGEPGLAQLARNAVQSITSFSLTPIPFFVLMGEVLFHTGVALKAIDAFALLIRRVPGRLAVIAIVAGTVFSAISGSTIATTALLGSLMLPTMLARGYDPRMAMGPIMGIGGVDMLIPPSALTVLLGSLASISIAGLLIGGIVPGLILSLMYVGYIIARATMNPALAPDEPVAEEGPQGAARWLPFVTHVVPLVLIFGLVIGAMTGGFATPTEAAAIGAAGTIVAAALYRSLSFANLMKALTGTVAVSGTILFIIVGATTFSQVLSFSGVVNGLVELVTGLGLSVNALMIAMLLILLFLGCFVDQVSMMLITLPFFMPLVQRYDVDLIWFGVLFLICMQLGLLTPPFGLLLFTMKGVAPPSITMQQIYAASMPLHRDERPDPGPDLPVSRHCDLASRRAEPVMPRSVRLDDLLPYLMNRLVARLNQNLGERLRRHGYSFQEWRVLAVLAGHDGITLSQLADAAVIPQPTVSRLVARLERRQFLRRRSGTRDSRFVEAWITRRGMAAYREMLPLAIEEYRSAVTGFGGKQTEWLRRATLRMIGNIGIELLRERLPQSVARPPAVRRPAVSTAAPRAARPPRGRRNRVPGTR